MFLCKHPVWAYVPQGLKRLKLTNPVCKQKSFYHVQRQTVVLVYVTHQCDRLCSLAGFFTSQPKLLPACRTKVSQRSCLLFSTAIHLNRMYNFMFLSVHINYCQISFSASVSMSSGLSELK
ncbi:hypothetical protein EGW08_005991 [Elysia chlorotica]|uniref:Uncharacterized protein n=1 Tax=Elysia chlorotica TaxID=188477 RepID=A0A433TXD2_ELYCH|nr:hypothetical protein EGW08_005991 [Elysia chlorotica]